MNQSSCVTILFSEQHPGFDDYLSLELGFILLPQRWSLKEQWREDFLYSCYVQVLAGISLRGSPYEGLSK